jgi:integration host factor subunit alpha
MTLTKAGIIEQIHDANPKLTKTRSRESLEILLKLMKNHLENGEDVLLSRFGKFNVKDKSSRKGRNPQSGEPLMLEARKVITFKASGILREKVNNNK